MPEPTPQSRRRRFALSVRGLMILVLLVGGPIGWKARRASLQHRAVAATRRVGGAVGYDWEADRSRPGATGPPAPAWARRWLGDEFFREVVGVDLPGMWILPRPPGKEAEADRIRATVEDARRADQLACLDGLDRIEFLDLIDFGFMQPEALDRLARFGRLKRLSIGPAIDAPTAAGLARLGSLETLTVITWPGKRIDPSFLDGLPHLVDLSLLGFEIDDAEMARIARLRKLERFAASFPGLTDAGLATLAGLTELTRLELSTMPLTAREAGPLRRLAKLRRVEFARFRSDPAALAAFRSARPGVQVILR